MLPTPSIFALDSPRVCMSTNPWKTTCGFETIANSKEEYEKLIERLAAEKPESRKKRAKIEISHTHLIDMLRGRLETIDNELQVSESLSCMNYLGLY